MTTTFHITRMRDGYTICDGHGVALVDATYDTEAGAADMAIRFPGPGHTALRRLL
jgi:hypothetical protein